MAFLGSALYGKNYAESIADFRDDDFFRPAHKLIHRAMLAVVGAGKGLDALTLKEELKRRDWLDQVGGDEYVLRLVEAVPSPANVEHYGRIVRENAVLRRIRDAAEAMTKLPEDPDLDVEEKIAKFIAIANGVDLGIGRGPISIADVDPGGWDEEELGVSTGFDELDKVTGYGYPLGQVTVVAALTKTGKTTYALSSMRRLALTGVASVYATFADMSPRLLVRRVITMETGIKRKPKNDAEWEAWERGKKMFHDPFADEGEAFWDVQFYDSTVHGIFVEDLCRELRSWFRERWRPIVFVDYAQRIRIRQKIDGRTAQLEEVSSQLSDLAAELKCAIVLGSQVTQTSPGVFDTKYAKALQEDAGWVLQIVRDDNSNKAVFNTAYGRFSKKGGVELAWDDQRLMFDDVD